MARAKAAERAAEEAQNALKEERERNAELEAAADGLRGHVATLESDAAELRAALGRIRERAGGLQAALQRAKGEVADAEVSRWGEEWIIEGQEGKRGGQNPNE